MQLAYIRTRKIQKPKGPTALEWMNARHLRTLLDQDNERLKELGLSRDEVAKEVLEKLK